MEERTAITRIWSALIAYIMYKAYFILIVKLISSLSTNIVCQKVSLTYLLPLFPWPRLGHTKWARKLWHDGSKQILTGLSSRCSRNCVGVAWPTIVTKIKTFCRFCFSDLDFLCVCVCPLHAQINQKFISIYILYISIVWPTQLCSAFVAIWWATCAAYLLHNQIERPLWPHNTNNITHTPHLPSTQTYLLFGFMQQAPAAPTPRPRAQYKKGFAFTFVCHCLESSASYLWHCVRAGQQLGSANGCSYNNNNNNTNIMNTNLAN